VWCVGCVVGVSYANISIILRNNLQNFCWFSIKLCLKSFIRWRTVVSSNGTSFQSLLGPLVGHKDNEMFWLQPQTSTWKLNFFSVMEGKWPQKDLNGLKLQNFYWFKWHFLVLYKNLSQTYVFTQVSKARLDVIKLFYVKFTPILAKTNQNALLINQSWKVYS